MPDEVSTFKCLRCGHEYQDRYSAEDGPKERTCPRCRSNSVRRVKPSRA